MTVVRRVKGSVEYTADQWAGPGHGAIKIAEGWTVEVRPGDWVITSPNGERDVCSAQEFFELYKAVSK